MKSFVFYLYCFVLGVLIHRYGNISIVIGMATALSIIILAYITEEYP